MVTLIRHTGDLEGELGVGVRKSCGHKAIRNALAGLACEIGVENLVALGYTSVLVDRGKFFVIWTIGAGSVWECAGDGAWGCPRYY